MGVVEIIGIYLTAISIYVAVWMARSTIQNESQLARQQLENARKIAAQQAEHEREVAADKVTFEFIVNHEIHGAEWAKTCAVCEPVLSDPSQWGKLFKKEKRKDGQEPELASNDSKGEQDRALAMTVLAYLNHYEIVAIAIKRRIISDDMYSMWYRDAYVESWNKSKTLVSHLRTIKDSETLYCEFKNLGERWSTPSSNADEIREAEPSP